MRIAFRADASAATGLGHVQRCLALAKALARTGSEIVFLTRPTDIDIAAWVGREGFAARTLASDNADEDAQASVAALRDGPPAWVVVDHYGLDAHWHGVVARATGARIAAVDDLADRRLEADLLVNHNLGASRARYQGLLPDRTTALLGPRYALLGPAYAAAPRHQPRPAVASIGIFMGGSDIQAMSLVALRACRDVAGFSGPIEIATTSANPSLPAWRRECDAWGGQTQLLVDAPHLADFFARHGLQVGAGGGAALERCCIGAPSVVIAWVDNQVAGVGALAACGAVVQAAPSAVGIGIAVRELLTSETARLDLSQRARDLVDGRGALRVALALAGGTVALRPATANDAAAALAWRNDPRTLLHSRNPALVALQDHLHWWARALEDPQRRLFIACCGDIEVGTLRFDSIGRDAELSIYLDPELSGLGLGRAVLRAGQAWCTARPRPLAVDLLVAEVHPDNRASAAIFAATGFRQRDERHWSWELPA